MVKIFKVRELRYGRFHKFCGINLPLEYDENNKDNFILLLVYFAHQFIHDTV